MWVAVIMLLPTFLITYNQDFMLHKFTSNSQIFVKCVLGGCVRSIKFCLAEGGCYYITTDESVVDAIRKHRMFRLGRITETIEEEAEEHKEEEQTETPLQDDYKPIKTKLTGRRFIAAVESEARQEEAEAETVSNDVQERGEEGKITIDSVKFYLEAKTYLKEVLHVDQQLISTKQKMKDYCNEHGIVFPNLTWQ